MDDDQIVYSQSLEIVHCIFTDNGERAHDIICETISKGPDHIHDIFCCTTVIMSEFVKIAKSKNQDMKKLVSNFCNSMISDKEPQTCIDEYMENATMPKYAGAPYDRKRDEEDIKKALERLKRKSDKIPDDFAARFRKLSQDEKDTLKRIKDKLEKQDKDDDDSDEGEKRWGA